MKISVVIPAYNVEKTLDRCLQSVFACNYSDCEIVVVNDGSTDSTGELLKNYGDRIKVITQHNQGLSMARNNGIKEITGDYFIVVDSDDYIEPGLLDKLAETVQQHDPDLIRFQIREIKGEKVTDYPETAFVEEGKKAFEKIAEFRYVEPAWLYCYKTSYFKENDFRYAKGMVHEDYGLTPLVIVKASKVVSIDYVGYDYIENPGSIMTSPNYEKLKKRVYDTYYQYLELVKYDGGKVYKSFLANSVLIRSKLLNDSDFREFEKLIRQNRIIDNLLDDTLMRKLKKLMMKINLRKTLNMR